VRDNLVTLYSAIDEGAVAVRIPKHARRELEAYLDCGLLCPARGRWTVRVISHSGSRVPSTSATLSDPRRRWHQRLA
jgi:hypothetical protein